VSLQDSLFSQMRAYNPTGSQLASENDELVSLLQREQQQALS